MWQSDLCRRHCVMCPAERGDHNTTHHTYQNRRMSQSSLTLDMFSNRNHWWWRWHKPDMIIIRVSLYSLHVSASCHARCKRVTRVMCVHCDCLTRTWHEGSDERAGATVTCLGLMISWSRVWHQWSTVSIQSKIWWRWRIISDKKISWYCTFCAVNVK